MLTAAAQVRLNTFGRCIVAQPSADASRLVIDHCRRRGFRRESERCCSPVRFRCSSLQADWPRMRRDSPMHPTKTL